MACCLCVTVPFTSWTAFSVGLLTEFDLTFADYLRAVPLMFYPLAMMLLTLLLAAGVFPKVGPLKRAYDRVRSGGAVSYTHLDVYKRQPMSAAWRTLPTPAAQAPAPW